MKGRAFTAAIALFAIACSSAEPDAPSSAASAVASSPVGSRDEHAAVKGPEGPTRAASTSMIVEGTPARAAPEPKRDAESEGMALVPAGSFTMGADAGGEPDERPAHTVTLAAFWLDLTEVTNEAYARCVDAGVCRALDATSAKKNGFGSDVGFRGPKQPVSSVSWDDARGYCAWVHKRLPIEAEWERAARGDDGRVYPWGTDAPTHAHAVFGGHGLTEEVGSHPRGKGPFGHLDLAGNVWEWVEDIYDPYAYGRAGAAEGRGGTCDETLAALAELRSLGKKGFTGANPIPTECERVLRGGAFNYAGPGLRASNRVHHPGRWRLVMAGFRCARDAK